ncbi:nucleotidyltransferase domain protein [bacterium BMS3Abin14]|nr:nucleotidyltransferase domain protein [bacterium BMS3Abin14]
MKRRDIVLEKLKDNAGELQRFHVSALSLFGSVVRGEEGPGSDVDLLVEFNEPVGMFTFIRLKNHLEKLLGAKVDLVTPEALKERLRDRILKEAIRAA